MKVGDKVFCKDVFNEFTGWIADICKSNPYPYSVVKNRKDIGKSFDELDYSYGDDSGFDELDYSYGDDSGFDVFELKDLTLLKDNSC